MGAVTFRPITLTEFEEMPQVEGKQEVNAGELLTMPLAQLAHLRIALAILEALQEHLRGTAYKAVPEAGFVLSHDPLTYRQPDVSIVSRSRLESPESSYLEGSPEMAIEIVSPSDTVAEMQAKAAQYLEHGALQVLVVYPSSKAVHQFAADGRVSVLDISDSVEVVGIRIPLAQFLIS